MIWKSSATSSLTTSETQHSLGNCPMKHIWHATTFTNLTITNMKTLVTYFTLILTWIFFMILAGFTFGFTISLLSWAAQLGGSLL